jgi:NADPH:quinone reductase-like Zn-dependent oxidoreductase
MRTYRLKQLGSVDGLVLQEEDVPEPKSTEIVMRVRAMSVNRRDAFIVNGAYPLPSQPNVVPLSDGAGEVVALGSAVTRFKVGDRVIGSYWPRWRDGRLTPDLGDQLGCTIDGMLTEYAVLDEQWAVAVSEHLSWEEAATLTCAGVTAWSAVVGSEAAHPGQTVLTLGTGGVAIFALQFAKMMGCTVIASTSRPAKAEKLRALGADHVIDYAAIPNWAETVRELTDGRGVDLIVETGGPKTIGQSLAAAGLYGHIVLLSVIDAEGNGLALPGQVYSRTMATLSRVFVGSRARLEAMCAAIGAHRMRPVIDRVFPFAEGREAYRYFMRGDLFGKVVIQGA